MANPMRLSRHSKTASFRRYNNKRVFARFYSHRRYLENAVDAFFVQVRWNMPNILWNKPASRKHIRVDLVWSQSACIARPRRQNMAFLPFSLYFLNKKWQYEINCVRKYIWCRIWWQIQCAYLDIPKRLRSWDTAANVYLQGFTVVVYISRTRPVHRKCKWQTMWSMSCRTSLHREYISLCARFSHKWRVKQGVWWELWQICLFLSIFWT